MANRRDLHVSIDGDAKGFDDACEEAEEKARGLDRELAKLERQQAAQEKITTRSTAAVDRFGRAQDKAALAAHKLGLEAKRAAEQAEKAEVRAAAAAEAASKGLLDEEKAARLAARAEDLTERASLKAAAAHRALAQAADEAADQERQLARDAQLAATAQRLGALRASGAVREYNALLAQTKANHGSLAGTAVADFKEIAGGASKVTREAKGMAAQFRELGAQWKLVGIVNGLALLPELASVAAGAITLGLGGAIAGVGLKFAAQDKRIRAEYKSLGHDIFASLGKDAAPFVTVLDHIAKEGETAFKSWEPDIRSAWASMAPVVDDFVAAGLSSLEEFKPAFASITRGFNVQLRTLTPQLAGDARNIATGIKAIGDAAAANPQALAGLVHDLTSVVRYGGDAIGFLVRFKSQFDLFNQVLTGGGPTQLLHIAEGVEHLGGFLKDGTQELLGMSHGFETAGGTFLTFDQQASGVAGVTSKLGKDIATLSDHTASATDKANALTDAFARLLNPAEAVFTDTARLKEGIASLSKALDKSHGSLNDNSAASRAAKQAFTGVLDSTKALATDMLNSHKSIDQVRASLNPYIHSLYEAAGGNKQAKALVDAFVRSLGLVPPKKSTDLTLNDRDFLSKLHNAQGLQIDPKTGLLKGDGSDYFNKWLKANGLRINPKTGLFRGNGSDYYNKWLIANHLKINTKTGKITGNTAPFWAAVHGIPPTVGYRKIGVYYVPLNSANEPGKTRANGGIDRYAAGGVRRDLDPFVATRPTVLFGETETGGEAYIPLGPNKRGRSTELLRQVAREFGLDVVKRIPVQAAPPVLSGASGGASGPAQVTQNNVFQAADPHVVARESARELAWMLR